MSAGILLIALFFDACFGWPERLHQRIGHPVTWLGKGIDLLDRELNPPRCAERQRERLRGRLRGLLTLLLVAGTSGLLGCLLQMALADSVWLWPLTALFAWPWFAMRSLGEHVEAVAIPLARADLPAARRAVSMIVGRNAETLEEAGVARAALESLAENTSDGVVAPLFWAWLLGLPGLFIYKSVNTLDSMIGHRNERHEHFGWASARFDDLLNLIPARLTGLLFALQGPMRHRKLSTILRAMLREAPQHRSPNAGWPESALARVLGVRLAGPRQYGETRVEAPFLNPEGRDPAAQDLERGLDCYRWLMRSVVVLLMIVALQQALIP